MAKKKKRRIVVPPIKGTKSLGAGYRRKLNQFGRALIAEVKQEVLAFLKAQESAYAMDGVADQLARIFAKLKGKFTGHATLSFAEATASQFVHKINATNKSKFDRTMARAFRGVNLNSVIADEGLEELIALNVHKNTGLITSLPDEYIKQVETIVNNNVASGAKYATIEKEIVSKTGVNSKLFGRIKTIAMNESQTINSQLSLRRTTKLGITRGIYRTSRDKAVRPSHRALDGQEFELSKGAWSKMENKYIQPGITDINCRCGYSPIIEV